MQYPLTRVFLLRSFDNPWSFLNFTKTHYATNTLNNKWCEMCLFKLANT